MSLRRRGLLGAAGGWFTRHPYVLPVAILVIGGAFRFYNLNWDAGNDLHPDERWIFMVVSGADGNPPLSWPHSLGQIFDIRPVVGSPLDPHSFAYGSLPFYLLAAVAGTISLFAQQIGLFSQWSQINTYGGLAELARGLSGGLDLLSVSLVFLIARRMYGYWTGVVAMFMAAVTVLNIQLSHFYTVDTVLLPFVLLTIFAAIQIAGSAGKSPYVWGGAALGAALATKTTALILVVPLGAAAILAAWHPEMWEQQGSLRGRILHIYEAASWELNRNFAWLLMTYGVAAVTFIIFEPYGVIDRAQLVRDISTQSTYLVTNNPPFQVPFTDQYAGTLPYLYQLKNLLFWSMGIPLALAAFAGVIFSLIRIAGVRFRKDEAVLLLWVFAYFLFVGHFFAKFNRYMLPIVPVTIVLGAAMLVYLLRSRRRWLRGAAGAGLAAVLIFSFLYALAYMNIYEHPNTRVAASQWIYTHVKTGSTIALESSWDDALPLSVGTHSPSLYTSPYPNLNLYDPDSPAKAAHIGQVLSQSNYVVMTSERLIGSIPRRPDAYPMTVRYYRLLLSGQLGYRLVRVFQQHPQLGPVVVHDYSADESFHVYDHPIVRILKRVRPVDASTISSLIQGQAPPARASTSLSGDARLLLSNRQWHEDQTGLTMDQMFPPHGFAMEHPILVWYVFIELLGLLAFPFAFVLFAGLADRGFVIAKTLGLLMFGYAAWIAVSVGLATFDRGLLLLVLVCLFGLSAALTFRLRHDLTAFLRLSWRHMLTGEAVFLVGFAIFIGLRMWYPDLGHQFSPVSGGNIGDGRMGEKQMELAFLNAIVRSRVFPPYDPFFAHGYINYYYYGFYLVGALAKLTQIMPATAFNLAIATFFGMLVGNVSSAVQTLTRRALPAIVAAAFVGFIGNLNGAWQVLQGLMQVSPLHLSWPVAGGIADVVSGVREVVSGQATLPPFDYWAPTRILPPIGGPITEFPFFTYLFADLHPHLLAYPMTAAALALAVSLAMRSYPSPVSALLSIILTAVLLGAIAVTNPWDFPTYLAVVIIGALVGSFAIRRRFVVREVLLIAAGVVTVTLMTSILYLPFKQTYQTVFVTGVGMVRDVTPQMLENSNVAPSDVHDALVTPLRLYLEHFGLFVFVVVSFLVALLWHEAGLRARVSGWLTGARFLLYYRDRLPAVRRAWKGTRRRRARREPVMDGSLLAGFLVLIVGLAALQDFLLSFLVGLLALTVLVLFRLGGRLSAAELFVLTLLVLPIALSIGTQVLFVKDWLAGGSDFRMNTIFKFYNQAWVLFGVCSASGLHFYLHHLRPKSLASTATRRIKFQRPSPAQAWAVRLVPALCFLGGRAMATSAGHDLFAIRLEQEEGQLEVGASDDVGDRPVASTPVPRPWTAVRALQQRPLWTAGLVVLMGASLIYTYAGTVSRETYRTTWLPENSIPATIDGMAFMKVAYPADYEGISWLNAHVHGSQVVAEAGDGYYDWRSRVSMFTGLPDILNGIHEGEQRYDDEIAARSSAVDTLYGTSDPAAAWGIIRQYDVRYIFVGFSERQCAHEPNKTQCYPRAGLRKFRRMVGHGLSIAFNRPGITIYRVTKA